MKAFILILLTSCITQHTIAQTKFPTVDKSPMDMIYFPADYPILKIKDKVTEPPAARVIYSRPQKNGRTVFGELVEYGMIWRLGANESTEIEFFRDAKIAGKKISKGRYTLYCIPNEQTWTIILNKEMDSWGAFKYDATKDVLRTEVPVQKMPEIMDVFSMTFEGTNNLASLVIAWDNLKAALPIEFLPVSASTNGSDNKSSNTAKKKKSK